MVLTANRDLAHYVDQQLRSFQAAAANLYKGVLLGADANGYARALVAGDPFMGIAYEQKDNSGGSDGDLSVRSFVQGDFDHALSGATLANIGDAVYASADDTLTFTATANSYVGHCVDVPSTGNIILRIAPFQTVT